LGLPVKVGDTLTLNRIGQRFTQPIHLGRIWLQAGFFRRRVWIIKQSFAKSRVKRSSTDQSFEVWAHADVASCQYWQESRL